MPESTMSVLLEIKDQKVMEELEKAISSLKGFHSYSKQMHPQDPGFYDLVILEVGDDYKKDLQFVHTLQTSRITRNVFLTSSVTHSEILIEALNLGIKGFFPQPIDTEDVRKALLKVKGQNEGGTETGEVVKKGRIIDVFGSKGGVGTTTVAINLAISLAGLENNPSVALIDLNPLFGEISAHLNMEPAFSWIEVMKNISRLDTTYITSILSRHSSGIYILPSPIELTDDYTPNPQALATLLKLMQAMFDYIVIDGGQLLDDNSRAVMKISNMVLLVCTLNLPCIINIKRLQNTFRKRGYPHEENIGIAVNRFYKNSDISIKDAEESLNQKILCCIPNVYKVATNAINQGKPICTTAKGTEIFKKFRELALSFTEEAEAGFLKENGKKREKGAFSFTSIFNQK
jgi:pilus assembly protein CpaE